MALARQIFNINGTWTAPAGVSRARVYAVPPSDYRITYSDATVAAIMNDGTTWSWGLGSSGQLGNGSSTAAVSSPVQVVGGLSFQKVAAVNQSTYGLDVLGNLWGWGTNGFGNLGNNSVTAVSSPVLVVGNIKFTGLVQNPTMTYQNFYGLDNAGNLWGWGSGAQGQLGNGSSTAAVSSPVQVVGGLKFTQFSAYITLNNTAVWAIDTSQNMWSWGLQFSGNLGQNNSTSSVSSPVQVVGGIKWQKVIGGAAVVIGLDTSGNVWTWGQYGGANLNTVSSPVKIVGGIVAQNVFSGGISSAGGEHLFILDYSNNLWAWGSNLNGELGIGTTTSASSPVQVVGGIKWQSAVMINAGNNYALGVDTSGNLWGWGSNAYGNLGNGTTTTVSSPVQVVGGLKWSSSNIMGDGTSIGVTVDGMIYGWGQNSSGQLGSNTAGGTSTSSPVQVVGGKLSNFQAIPSAFTFDVTPGVSYSVTVNPGLYSYFGTNPLRAFTSQVIVEYEQ